MKNEVFKLEECEPVMRKVLEAGGTFTFYPRGISMEPFIHQGRDQVRLAPLPENLKKYHIVLYKRKNGAFVLHRIIRKREDGYVFRGDHQFVNEYGVTEEQMIGIVTEIIRSGGVIRVNDRKQRFWAMVWVRTVLLRRIWKYLVRKINIRK